VVVYASSSPGAAAYDASLPYLVVRDPTTMLLPTPVVARRVRAVARAEGTGSVWFGAAAPLGLLARGLRRSGADRLVATTHGHEAGWAALPGGRSVLHRIGEDVDVLTYLGEYTRRRIARALSARAAGAMVALPPGVDTAVFHPGAGGTSIRQRHGLAGRAVVVCVSRLVPRKGQDVLIRALPQIRRRVPDAAVLLVGDGPYRPRLERLVAELRLEPHVRFTGSVPWSELPAHYDAGDVFAMPARTRRGGLDVEGLGIVYLEASATGLAVVAGDSGGAPDAVLDGRTGMVVPGRRVELVADHVAGLLADPGRAAVLGRAGREWVSAEWGWDRLAARLARACGIAG
ncbi:MAG: glycosyltransferase family 4 protein, partial [Actinomycetes bacterium]